MPVLKLNPVVAGVKARTTLLTLATTLGATYLLEQESEPNEMGVSSLLLKKI